METLITVLRRWNTEKNERQKLQLAYSIVGCALVLLAGLVTFLNASLGYGMLWVGLVLLAAFLLNGVAWHLMASALLPKLKQKPTPRKRS